MKVDGESGLLDVALSDTDTAVLGAAEDKVTVHVPLAFELNVDGLHASEEITSEVGALNVSATLCEDPL
jgi:hypothetical protein